MGKLRNKVDRGDFANPQVIDPAPAVWMLDEVRQLVANDR